MHEPNGIGHPGSPGPPDVLESDLADLSGTGLEAVRELPRDLRNQRLIDRASRPRGNAMVGGGNPPGVAE